MIWANCKSSWCIRNVKLSWQFTSAWIRFVGIFASSKLMENQRNLSDFGRKKMYFFHLIATKLQTMITISLWICNLKLAHHTENTWTEFKFKYNMLQQLHIYEENSIYILLISCRAPSHGTTVEFAHHLPHQYLNIVAMHWNIVKVVFFCVVEHRAYLVLQYVLYWALCTNDMAFVINYLSFEANVCGLCMC